MNRTEEIREGEAGGPGDRWLLELCSLVQEGEAEVRRAAARVLGAMRPPAPEVVEALSQALGAQDTGLRLAALEALASIGGAKAYERVTPLLDEESDVGRRAVEVATGVGRPMLPFLRRHFDRAGEAGRRRILQVAAQLRTPEAFDLVLRALESGQGAAVLEASRVVQEGAPGLSPEERTAIAGKMSAFLRSPAAQKSPDGAAAAVDLLARVSGEGNIDLLMENARPKRPPVVRRRALEALARLNAGHRLEPALAGELLTFLRDPDYSNVVQPAMAVLESASLGAVHCAPLLALLRGEDPALRRFAVSALGQVDTPTSAAALLAVLRGDNPDLQERAAASLGRQKAALPLLVEALPESGDVRTAWSISRILQPQAGSLKPAHVEAIAKTAAAWLEPGDPRAEALLALLRSRFSGQLLDACMARVRRVRRGRAPGEIANLLRPLVRDGVSLPAEARYELALAEVMRGKKDTAREARVTHPGLALLEDLARDPEFGLLARLKREKTTLNGEELYLIGCHFSERANSDRALGGDLLHFVAAHFPGEECSQAALTKLNMEGFPPPAKPPAEGGERTVRKRAPSRRKAR